MFYNCSVFFRDCITRFLIFAVSIFSNRPYLLHISSQIFLWFLQFSTRSYFSQLLNTFRPFSLLHLFKWFYFFVCFVMLFLQFSMFWTTRVCIFCFFPHVSKVFDVFPFITLFLHVFTVLASLDLFTLLSHFFHHIFLQFSSRPSHTFSRFLEVYFICYSFPLKRVSKLSTLKTVEKFWDCEENTTRIAQKM